MWHGSKSRSAMTTLAVPFLLLVPCGCGHDNPTSTGTANVTLSAAKISVNDQSIDGVAIHQGEYSGQVRYEARLVDPHGEPVSGWRVRVQSELSGMMGHMGGYTGEFYCYDDGTHGDPIPRDGVYCFVDSAGAYGCHRANAQPGEYHYNFCGVDAHGYESNRIGVSVNLLP